MATKPSTESYDPAAYLRTPHECATYLQAAIDQSEGDAGLVAAALGDIARTRGMAQLSRKIGLTREGLYKALSARGNPSFATVVRACGALGLTLHVRPVESEQED